jgi:hypothetical protein
VPSLLLLLLLFSYNQLNESTREQKSVVLASLHLRRALENVRVRWKCAWANRWRTNGIVEKLRACFRSIADEMCYFSHLFFSFNISLFSRVLFLNYSDVCESALWNKKLLLYMKELFYFFFLFYKHKTQMFFILIWWKANDIWIYFLNVTTSIFVRKRIIKKKFFIKKLLLKSLKISLQKKFNAVIIINCEIC